MTGKKGSGAGGTGKGGGKGPGKVQAGRVRVRTARGRSASSNRWLERQLNDPYVKRARIDGYRARAAYKLLELDERFGILSGATRIVDLGAAPGSWSQVALKRNPRARIVGIDLLPVEPLAGLTFFQGDFLSDEMTDQLREAMGGKVDLVMSDMAANTVGHHGTDHIRTIALVEAAAYFAIDHLLTGGTFIAKVLAGGAENALVAELKRHFTSVRHAKPPASRKESSETYVIAMGFKGATA